MTEPEAQVCAERLRRIWGIVHVRKSGLSRDEKRGFYFVGTSTHFSFRADEEQPGLLSFTMDGPTEAGHRGRLVYKEGNNRGPFAKQVAQDQFVTRWMDFFHHRCWLSGCSIEANEKAEWMQGFTREEMEAWNLKF